MRVWPVQWESAINSQDGCMLAMNCSCWSLNPPCRIPRSAWTESRKSQGSVSAWVCLSLSLRTAGWHQTHTNGSQCAAGSGLWTLPILLWYEVIVVSIYDVKDKLCKLPLGVFLLCFNASWSLHCNLLGSFSTGLISGIQLHNML